MKLIGKRSAGKPHAAFDVAEAGNMICTGCVRQSSTLPDGEGLETGLLVPRQSFTRQLFYKWIKQHLRIKTFYGTSKNAVFCQIWIALCLFLILAIAKKRWKINQTLYSFSQVCGITPFEKVPLNELLNKSPIIVPIDDTPNLFSNSNI